jgi:hypothetical protein
MGAAEKMPQYFGEAEAARKLTISKALLARERLAGRIHPMRMGQRVIRYTDEILDEYRRLCRNAPDKSATTGSASGRDRSNGAEPGTTPPLDRQSAHRLAQQTFRRPKSLSPNGSSSTQS